MFASADGDANEWDGNKWINSKQKIISSGTQIPIKFGHIQLPDCICTYTYLHTYNYS